MQFTRYLLTWLQFSEDSEDSYFQDPDGKELVPGSAPQPQRQTRKDAEVQGTSLTYVIPIDPQVGVWGMMKRIGRWRTEGWSSLFKGESTRTQPSWCSRR
jgi:fusion and transport protein UGO1